MIYIIIISLIIIIVPPIFIILSNLDYRKTIISECSQVYGIELNTISVKYTILEDRVAKYPMMNKEIKRLIKLEKDKYVDINKLVVGKFKISDLVPLCKSIQLFNEIDECKDKGVIDLFDDVREMNHKIATVRSPLKCKINGMKSKIQFFIILIIVKLFNKFKDFTRQDIEQVEKDNDFTVDSNLGLLN